VSLPFITFCNQISKAMARTLVYEPGAMIRVSNDAVEVKAKLRSTLELVLEWSGILTHYAAFGWPPPKLTPPPEKIAHITRVFILRAIEWFSIAHEYGHHVMKHGQAASSEDQSDHFHEEHQSDIFARAISMALGAREEVPNYYAIFGAGGVIMLGMLDLVRRTKAVLETGGDEVVPRERHPPYVDRVAALAGMDEHLPHQQREAAADMRASFEKIIEVIWDEVRPVIQKLHKSGLRPQLGAPDVGGWLPS
jgi:hypothetical protein